MPEHGNAPGPGPSGREDDVAGTILAQPSADPGPELIAPDPRLVLAAWRLGVTIEEAREMYPPGRLAFLAAIGQEPGASAVQLLEARAREDAITACPHCGRDSCPGDCRRLDPSGARVYGLDDFLRLELAPRRPLLLGPSGAPVLREKDLGMIFAPRGVGKTWLTLGIALAVASRGRFLRWRAAERRRVLVCDGEMPAGTLQERLRLLARAVEPTEDPELRVLAADVQDEPLPSLASPSGQALIEEHLQGVALLILDNVSTLMGVGDENDAALWEPAQAWLLSLRRRGLSVLLAHHAGRAGHARGTSRREDVLDLVVRLVPPADYSPDHGARFEVRFDKARGASGVDVEAFEARLTGDTWALADVASKNYEAAIEMFEQGARPGEVADALGIGRATAFRYQRQARQEGRISTPKKGKAR